jgi:hypothetical protein
MTFEIFIILPTDEHTVLLTDNYSQAQQIIYDKNIQLIHFCAMCFSHYSHHQAKSLQKPIKEVKYSKDFA